MVLVAHAHGPAATHVPGEPGVTVALKALAPLEPPTFRTAAPAELRLEPVGVRAIGVDGEPVVVKVTVSQALQTIVPAGIADQKLEHAQKTAVGEAGLVA